MVSGVQPVSESQKPTCWRPCALNVPRGWLWRTSVFPSCARVACISRRQLGSKWPAGPDRAMVTKVAVDGCFAHPSPIGVFHNVAFFGTGSDQVPVSARNRRAWILSTRGVRSAACAAAHAKNATATSHLRIAMVKLPPRAPRSAPAISQRSAASAPGWQNWLRNRCAPKQCSGYSPDPGHRCTRRNFG